MKKAIICAFVAAAVAAPCIYGFASTEPSPVGGLLAATASITAQAGPKLQGSSTQNAEGRRDGYRKIARSSWTGELANFSNSASFPSETACTIPLLAWGGISSEGFGSSRSPPLAQQTSTPVRLRTPPYPGPF